MTQICPKCGKELRIWEIVDYPPAWIKAHPEIAGMCGEPYAGKKKR